MNYKYIGALKRRRKLVMDALKDFCREVRDKRNRRSVYVIWEERKVIEGRSEEYPTIIIPKKDGYGNYYETVRIRIDRLIIDSDVKSVLLPILKALKYEAFGPNIVSCDLHFKRLKRIDGKLVYTPYVKIKGRARLSDSLAELINKICRERGGNRM